jgi:hypothetical protein
MDFQHSDRALHWQDRLQRFMDDKVLRAPPNTGPRSMPITPSSRRSWRP